MAKNRAKHTPSVADRERQRQRLQRRLCSPYWVEVAQSLGRDALPTGWVTCPACHCPYPPYYVATVCEDCRLCGLTGDRLARLPGSNFAPLLGG